MVIIEGHYLIEGHCPEAMDGIEGTDTEARRVGRS
jgi:hypothetical protein